MWVCPIGQNRYHGCEGCSPIPLGIGTQHSGRTEVLPKEKGGLLGKELQLVWEGCLGKSCHFLILGGLLGKELPLFCAWAVGMELAFAHSVVLLPGASQADQST